MKIIKLAAPLIMATVMVLGYPATSQAAILPQSSISSLALMKCNSTSRTVGAMGFDLKGLWAGATLSKCRSNSMYNTTVGMGAGGAAAYLCARIEKLPYGFLWAAGCIAYVGATIGHVKADLKYAKTHDRRCVQFRHGYGWLPRWPSRIVKCVYPRSSSGGGSW